MSGLTDEEQRYAQAFAQAIAEDVRDHPPGSSLVRVVIRWFEAEDPTYFGVHALGLEDQADVDPEDAWHPLEWPNVAEEEERTERLGGHRSLQQAAEALKAQYLDAEDDRGSEWGPSPGTLAAVRRLPGALREAEVGLEAHFAASAGHSDGRGCRDVLHAVASRKVLKALAARDELPDD